MTFVGVNGVGKSTNLSKVCFWLLQNGYRVLIAACDTFRSGAVEQLRVHVRNLGALAEDGGEGEKRIELFEKGYGKDAAGIAKDAITYGQSSILFSHRLVSSRRMVLFESLLESGAHGHVAKENKFDVVLIDTAGRMQDNEPLMRALAKVSLSPSLTPKLPSLLPRVKSHDHILIPSISTRLDHRPDPVACDSKQPRQDLVRRRGTRRQ